MYSAYCIVLHCTVLHCTTYILYVYCIVFIVLYYSNTYCIVMGMSSILQVLGVPSESYRFKLVAAECNGNIAIWKQRNTVAISLAFPNFSILKFSSGNGEFLNWFINLKLNWIMNKINFITLWTVFYYFLCCYRNSDTTSVGSATWIPSHLSGNRRENGHLHT